MADRRISVSQALNEISALVGEIALKAAQHDYYRSLLQACASAFDTQEKSLAELIKERDDWQQKAETLKAYVQSLSAGADEADDATIPTVPN